MFRRKTRNSTAYTGVGYAGPLAQAPNNTAMAAALTIGQNLKQSQPEVYGSPSTRTNSTLQPQPQPQRPSQTQVSESGSLLKRSSSIQQGMSWKARNVSSSKPNYTRMGSILSQPRHLSPKIEHPHVYSVDDSFNDSFFEEVGQETDAHYSNEAQLRDLRLHHRPPLALPPATKMVKKYIPTPNGITVVEVPEESLKKEIAHTNSMRSKPSGVRSGSIRGNRSHSFTNATQAKQGNRSLLSSIVSTTRIDENTELDLQRQQNELAELNFQRKQNELAELKHQRQQNELARLDRQRKQKESAELQRQLDHERRIAHELEKQCREYEQLLQLRTENERKLRELQSLQGQDSDSLRDVSSFEDRAPMSNGTVATSSVNEKSYVIEEEEDHRAESQSVEDDVPIKALSFVVDEFDSRKINGDNHINGEAVSTTNNETIIESNRGSPFAHDAIIDTYVESSPPYNDVEIHRSQVSVDDIGIEGIAPANFDSPNLTTQLRPTFVQNSVESLPHRNNMTRKLEADCSNTEKHQSGPSFNPMQEIIGTQNSRSPDLEPATVPDMVVVPPALASSIRSSSSLDSKSKPIKSAMKNSRSAYSQSNNSSDNPAHQAYLSLTTAENTRLNSKLSAPKLHEGSVPEPKSPHSPSRRMSQSLRKQPSATTQGGLAGRSLRPQSTIESNGAARTQSGGMRSRNLKGFSSSHNQPIAPHPMTKANYKSPSKIKAAELYAKANKRPLSEFHVRERKSSFSRESDLEERTDGDGDVPLISRHRMTLRAPVSVSNPQQQAAAPVQQNFYSKNSIQSQAHVSRGISSKYADSDDESGPATGKTSTKFISRFADSDDEGPASRISSGNRVQDASMKSLRNKEESAPEKKAKEKKPKKKFLKKLFGRN